MYSDLINIRDIASKWIITLYDIGDFFVNRSVGEFLHILGDLVDQFPFLELLNLVIKPLYWILNSFGVGQLTLFEFTLGGAISLIVTVNLIKWLLSAVPIL